MQSFDEATQLALLRLSGADPQLLVELEACTGKSLDLSTDSAGPATQLVENRFDVSGSTAL